MARIFYIWEFGGGLGHLTTALPLANAYRARGHEVAFAVKDIAAASTVIRADTYAIYQAPVWQLMGNTTLPRPISYAEILLNHGYGNPQHLTSMVRAWIGLFKLVAPDLLVLDFSPTAMLAAHILGLHHCTIGHGFFLPPRMTPVPAFVPDADPDRLARSEEALLRSINRARAMFGKTPLACFGDFFDTDLDLLTTWPEIEHYPQRKAGQYRGPILMRLPREAPKWRDGSEHRVCVYLYGSYPKIEIVLRAIDASRVDAALFIPGVPENLLRQFRNDRMRFFSAPFALEELLVDANALISHGNFGTVWEGLLSGKPMLCLPVHMEQWIVTQRLTDLGAGIRSGQDLTVDAINAHLEYLVTQQDFGAAAGRIARKYRNHNVAGHLEHLVNASCDGF